MTFQHIRPGHPRSKYETQEVSALLDVLTDRPFRFCMYEGTDQEAWILWADGNRVHHIVWDGRGWKPPPE